MKAEPPNKVSDSHVSGMHQLMKMGISKILLVV